MAPSNKSIGSSQDFLMGNRKFEFLGIEFAPFFLPLERRLQTLAVMYWILTYLTAGLLSSLLLLYLLFYTKYWWVSVLYFSWMVYDKNTCNKGGRAQWAVDIGRRWTLWKHYANFFPIKLVKTAEMDPDTNYLLGSHPHGVLSSGAFCCFGTEGGEFAEVFPGMEPHLLTLEGQFWIPGYREMFALSGCCSTTKSSMEFLLRRPKSQAVVLVVGGAPEALNTEPGKVTLILHRRKGWIKLALRHGTSLIPTFSFGENAIYDQVPNPKGSFLRNFQEWLMKVVGFAPVLFLGRGVFQYNFGIIPHRRPIHVVVGKPIPVEKVEDPSREEVEALHAKYVEELVKLYIQYNPLYGDKNVELVIT